MTKQNKITRRNFIKWISQATGAVFFAGAGWLGTSHAGPAGPIGECDQVNCTSTVDYECINGMGYRVTKTTCYSATTGNFCSYGETKIAAGITC